MKLIRQGDILFKRLDESLEGKVTKRLTIAEGEVTGHHHVLVAEGKSVIRGTKTKFEVTGKAKLIHPEHDTIEFSSGVYIVIPEREWDYVEQTLVAVKD